MAYVYWLVNYMESQSKYLGVLCFTTIFMVIANVPVYAALSGDGVALQENQQTQNSGLSLQEVTSGVQDSGQIIDVSGGIKPVSTQQVITKINKISTEVYAAARGSIGWWAVAALIILAILSLVFKAARIGMVFVVIGVIVVMEGPQLLGWCMHLLSL